VILDDYLLIIVVNTKYTHTNYQYTSPECFQSDHSLLQCTLRAGDPSNLAKGNVESRFSSLRTHPVCVLPAAH
jgi:hypothetical protein